MPMTHVEESIAVPKFPHWKPLRISDEAVIAQYFHQYQPSVSELTTTSLMLWNALDRYHWCVEGDFLLLLSHALGDGAVLFQPVGLGPRRWLVHRLFEWARDTLRFESVEMVRVDSRLAAELRDDECLAISEEPQHFDYVYQTEDLILLKGKKYHGQRNHLNRFQREYQVSFEHLGEEHIQDCIELASRWYEVKKDGELDGVLTAEFRGICDVLTNLGSLRMRGGVVRLDGRVEAFSFGHALNERTAVIHVEKANPKIPNLAAVINREFLAHTWADFVLVNREEDAGHPGLRVAKLAYHPLYLERKYIVRPRR